MIEIVSNCWVSTFRGRSVSEGQLPPSGQPAAHLGGAGLGPAPPLGKEPSGRPFTVPAPSEPAMAQNRLHSHFLWASVLVLVGIDQWTCVCPDQTGRHLLGAVTFQREVHPFQHFMYEGLWKKGVSPPERRLG